MYIAFKWLAGLTFAMWMAMCLIDVYVKKNKEIIEKGSRTYTSWQYENSTDKSQADLEHLLDNEKYTKVYHQHFIVAYHYLMFFAGAFAVCVFNKKTEIIFFTKNTISKIDLRAIVKVTSKSLKNNATSLYGTIGKYLRIVLIKSLTKIYKIHLPHRIFIRKEPELKEGLNMLLLKKLKEFGVEKKKLGQLLIAAVQENKHLRTQFQLENMAKTRLVKHIEDTQQKIKENRSKYVSFQQLYLVTHQENIFLKARIQKMKIEKENAEKDLLTLINKVIQSKNNELKAYCTQFIVKPNNNLLHGNAKQEIQKFLRESAAGSRNNPDHSNGDGKTSLDVPRYLDLQLTEIFEKDASFYPLVSGAPRLKGLPGEYIWTVKDKDGMIEKLYECDFESDLDKGDTIRRIREYSVYYDKDCLLDFSSSRTIVTESSDPIFRKCLCPTNGRFLTGSEAFKIFMQNNQNLVPNSPSILCV